MKAKLAADLDELRRLTGLSYRELARRTGCARSTLHDALTGRRFPRLDTVLAIVRACDGNIAGWRKRWSEASRQPPDAQPAYVLDDLLNLLDLLDIPQEQIVHAVTRWQQATQAPGTAARMSRQSTRPS